VVILASLRLPDSLKPAGWRSGLGCLSSRFAFVQSALPHGAAVRTAADLIMLILHGNWTDGALHIWGESLAKCLAPDPNHVGDDHPFAAGGSELPAAVRRLLAIPKEESLAVDRVAIRLPSVDGRPFPSERLVGLVPAVEDGEAVLREVIVPAVRIPHAAAPVVLTASDTDRHSGDVVAAHSLRYWSEVARFTLDLLVNQRFVPTVFRSPDLALRAGWQPWLHDETARKGLELLLRTMPAVIRGTPAMAGARPWHILDEVLRSWTDAMVRDVLKREAYLDAVEGREPSDPHVAWLSGLLGESCDIAGVEGVQSDLLPAVSRWLDGLSDAAIGRSVRLGLRLVEPAPETTDQSEPWCVEFLLIDADHPARRVTAEELARDPVAASGLLGGTQNPEEVLLAELARAARIMPMLERALGAAHPVSLSVSTGEAHTFLTELMPLLEESGFFVEVPNWWGAPAAGMSVRLRLSSPELTEVEALGAGGGGPSVVGLDAIIRYDWEVAVGDRTLAFDEFRELVSRATGGASLLRIHGQWVEVRAEELSEAAALFDSKPGGEMSLLEALQIAGGGAGSGIGLPVQGFVASGWVRDLLEAADGGERMPLLDPPEGFEGSLRPYQRAGLSWLAFLDRFGLGACLADDMGLGKTIQLIALLLWERNRTDAPAPGATLVIAPTSVIANWLRELERFAPALRVLVHHGQQRLSGAALLDEINRSDVVLTSYSLMTRDRDSLIRPVWHRVVLDEAQYIKNPPTKQTATIRALQTRRRIALTGTPVENRLAELWSIVDFLNPGYLSTQAEFRRRFAGPIERQRDGQAAARLRRIVRPFILRRLKTDPTVIDDLPPCVTTREYAPLTAEQAMLYERTVKDMLTEVGAAEGIRRRGLVLATLGRLKQICDHPGLIGLDQDVGEQALLQEPGFARLAARSGKCIRLMELLDEVVAADGHALVFTQFRRMGHLLAAMVQHSLGVAPLFLHGGTPTGKRQQLIDRFQERTSEAPVLILSLKAGGVGLNLTAANHVFHFDRWWNPAVENQATDRAFRIGQTRTVQVHKFVCTGTLEERIDQMIEQKMQLAENIIGAGEDWLTELSTGQLRDLLSLRTTADDADDLIDGDSDDVADLSGGLSADVIAADVSRGGVN